jgi:cytidylate kinase
MEPVRVYLSGPAGAGKTEAATWLCRRHGFTRISLGDMCRAEAERLGWPCDRVHLQAAGDRVRGGDPARLAAMALERARRLGDAVIDGVRLVAEAEYLRAHGVIGVRVEAPDAVRRARLRQRDGSGEVPAHATETEAAMVPTDLVLSAATLPLAYDRNLRLLVARLVALRATRRAEARRPRVLSQNGIR